MPGTNDFLPFAVGGGANVLTQAQWAALAATLIANGFQTGTANSAQINKAFRQSTLMAAIIGSFVADVSGQNVVDDGTTATILSNLMASIMKAGYVDDTGAVNAYVLTLSPAPLAYYDGMEVSFSTPNANTINNPTANVNGLGAITITNPGGGALLGGQIPANSPVKMIYNSTGPRFELVNRALNGNLNGMDSYSATGSIPTSGFGKLSRYTGSTAAQTLSLPAANSAPSGSVIWLTNQASVDVTVARASTDTINVANPYGAATNLTSFVLAKGDTVALMTDGSGVWENLFSPNQYKFSASYAVGSNGYQRLPSGLILQIGTGTTVGGVLTVTFATAFPTGIIMALASITQNTAQIAVITSKSTTQLAVATYSSTTGGSANSAFDWMAIGY